jgi:predicted DNA-binding WGR domain protein
MESHFIYLEKHHERQARFYAMYLAQTLFGDWTLIRCWGRIGHQGGQKKTDWFDTLEDAQAALEGKTREKIKRGYREPRRP